MFNIYLPIIIFSVLILALLAWNILLEIRLKKIFRGKNGASLESIITKHSEEIELLAKKELDSASLIKILQNKFTKSIQGIGIVRFNPFRESGGNHSFAIALVDENNDGIVISTMHARERTNIFAKSITGGRSEIELTSEESKALSQAKQK